MAKLAQDFLQWLEQEQPQTIETINGTGALADDAAERITGLLNAFRAQADAQGMNE